MKWGTFFATIAVFALVIGLFGPIPALWLATVVIAYCIGALWGVGSQMRRQQEMDAT